LLSALCFCEKFVALQLSTFATQSATSGLVHCSKEHYYSITSSARLELATSLTVLGAQRKRKDALPSTEHGAIQPSADIAPTPTNASLDAISPAPTEGGAPTQTVAT
jgi:hypothetical protein